MCVLTYVPVADKGFIVTSNRDENIARPKANSPKKIKVNGVEVFCPIDPTSNGTWVATAKHYTMVLLNGGYRNHVSTANYRQSRGQVIAEFVKWNHPETFFKKFDFVGMEPFTLVLFKNEGRKEITEIKWCSNEKFITRLSGDTALIWSSATLYNQQATENRRSWFLEHLSTISEKISGETILDFHYSGGKHDLENSIKLKRKGGIETVCITQIEVRPKTKSLFYFDMLAGKARRYIIL
jgi:Transport and Golgi organisation 2